MVLHTKMHPRPSKTTAKRLASASIATMLFAASLLLGTTQPAAAANVAGVNILEIAIDPAYGNFVFIRVSTPPSGTACATSGYWHYTLSFTNTASAQQYAALLSAQMAGKTVSITGSGACSENSAVESLRGMNVQS